MRLLSTTGLLALAGLLLCPSIVAAQSVTVALEGGGGLTARGVQLFALISVLSIAPGLAIMLTCFPFLVTVLSILRQALGLQQVPPNMLIVSLALFLTYFIMAPVFEEAWQMGIAPLIAEEIPLETAVAETLTPLRGFMAARTDGETYVTLAALRPETADSLLNQDAPLSLLVPSFLLLEISRAFQIGFLIFLPFLIIDLVVAAVLMSMGMMMVPPAVVSLPFKLAFFVMADGWRLLAEALVRGYG